jgi:hypothetical protein
MFQFIMRPEENKGEVVVEIWGLKAGGCMGAL